MVIVGCFNVGKLSLLNVFFNEECVIVLDIVGIIRDMIDVFVNFDGVIL